MVRAPAAERVLPDLAPFPVGRPAAVGLPPAGQQVAAVLPLVGRRVEALAPRLQAAAAVQPSRDSRS